VLLPLVERDDKPDGHKQQRHATRSHGSGAQLVEARGEGQSEQKRKACAEVEIALGCLLSGVSARQSQAMSVVGLDVRDDTPPPPATVARNRARRRSPKVKSDHQNGGLLRPGFDLQITLS
jgi:hypothetical protein